MNPSGPDSASRPSTPSPTGRRGLLSGFLGRGRDRAQVAIIINQLATPGLGSWIAGRRLAGAGQMFVAFAGFALLVLYFGAWMVGAVKAIASGFDLVAPPDSWWKIGLALFGAAWLWAGVTSLQLWWAQRVSNADPRTPPRLSS